MPHPPRAALVPFLLLLLTAACEDATVARPDEIAPHDGGAADTGSLGDAGAADTSTTGTADAGDPYAAIQDLKDDALRQALYDRIKGHTALGYDGARDAMLGITGTFDLQGGKLECIYTGRLALPDGTRTPDGFNTEHSWPQGNGASSEPARSDLHHLFPVDDGANNQRGSFPFAMTDCVGTTGTNACKFQQGGSELGIRSGGTETVFEVRPEKRGDIARAHFYFSVRYQLPITALEEVPLRDWNQSDPPDAVERARNDAIEALQKNRNPFVDRTDFVSRISDF